MIAGNATEMIEAVVNEPQDLLCEASGTEPLEMEWLRNGQNIDFDGVRGSNNYLQVRIFLKFF